ncbi:MAG: TlpA disulfide reductase family protein [Verrucomicrobiota bacterium]
MKALLLALLALLFISPSLDAGSTKRNIGKKMPALPAQYVANAPRSTQGKPKLVEFWATWCGPCKRSVPHLNKIHKTFSPKGLVVVGLSKETPQEIKDFTKKYGVKYPMSIDSNGKLQKRFGVNSIPHALLVNSAGKIVWEGSPSKLTNEVISQKLQLSAVAPQRSLPKSL